MMSLTKRSYIGTMMAGFGVPASVDRNPEGEKPQALSAEHESAAPKADAQPSTPEIEAEISRLNPLPAITRLNGGES